MVMTRVPPTRFGLDRSGVPGDSHHATVMNWYATHTNVRIVGGYVGGGKGAAWAKVIVPDWEAGWGVALFANTPSGTEWGTYRGSYKGQSFTFDSGSGFGALAILNGPQDVVTSAQNVAASLKQAMKRLFPTIRRPILFLDNEDASPTTVAPAAIPDTVARDRHNQPAPTGAQSTLFNWLHANRNATDPIDTVMADASGSTRQAHGIDAALPWLREAIRALTVPDPDGFAVRPALYAHTNLVASLLADVPDLLLCDVNYGGQSRNAANAPPHSIAPHDDFYLFPGVNNFTLKPQADFPKVKLTGRSSSFTVCPTIVQWVGDNAFQVPDANAVRSLSVSGATVIGMDYDAALVDDPLTLSPGPRFSIGSDGWLWRIDRVAASQGGTPRPGIASISCVNLAKRGAPAPPVLRSAMAGSARVLPTERPRPVQVGGRTLALVACQDTGNGGVGLAYTERTGNSTPLAAPKVAVAADTAVGVDSPLAVVVSGSAVNIATVGRDNHLRVARFDPAARNPASWTDTKLLVTGGIAIRSIGGSTWIAAVTEDNQHNPTLSVIGSPPWPPSAAVPLPVGRPAVPPLATTRLALREYLNQPVLLYVGADLTLYYQTLSGRTWSAPARVTDETLSPFTTLAAVESGSGLEILAIREDLTLQLYALTPGRAGTVMGSLLAPSDPVDRRHPAFFARVPNPYGDLGLAVVGKQRLVAVNRTTAPAPPAPGTASLPERFGTIAFTGQQISPPGTITPWTDLA